jgi:hypothetical protein
VALKSACRFGSRPPVAMSSGAALVPSATGILKTISVRPRPPVARTISGPLSGRGGSVSHPTRYRTWRLDRADLYQAGLLRLLVAATRFDPGRSVPFAAYAHVWLRKEIQRAIARQEFPAVLPAELIGRTVALRRALDENVDRLALAAAALGLAPATVAALYRRLDVPVASEEDELPAPGYVLADPEGHA